MMRNYWRKNWEKILLAFALVLYLTTNYYLREQILTRSTAGTARETVQEDFGRKSFASADF